MGANPSDWELEAQPGWVGPCFQKLKKLAKGKQPPEVLTAEEAAYLRVVLANMGHLQFYGEGYAQWVARRTINQGRLQKYDLPFDAGDEVAWAPRSEG